MPSVMIIGLNYIVYYIVYRLQLCIIATMIVRGDDDELSTFVVHNTLFRPSSLDTANVIYNLMLINMLLRAIVMQRSQQRTINEKIKIL